MNPEPLTPEQEAWLKKQTKEHACAECGENRPTCDRRMDPVQNIIFGRIRYRTLCTPCYNYLLKSAS